MTDLQPTQPDPELGNGHRLVRPTALRRRWVRPRLTVARFGGHHPSDPAVRRFWTPVIGNAAVIDLLRLTRSAAERRPIREPVRLPMLLAEQLVVRYGDFVFLPQRIPYLSDRHLRRLPAGLRSEYLSLVGR